MTGVRVPRRTTTSPRATALAVAALLGAAVIGLTAQKRASFPRTLRLYIFDCGTLESADMSRYRLNESEVDTTKMSVSCYLVAHPKGLLMWDVGAVPDASWTPTGEPQEQHLTLPDGQARTVTVTTPLVAQLAAAGYAPRDVTYLALSHYHYDHTANANEFASATWLARRIEREAMFADPPPALTQPSTYAALKTAKTRLLGREDGDVFGDGTVVLKLAPGHTPGHQVLYVTLAKTGGVVLSGDLYHYPAERALARVPTFEFSEAQTITSRVAIDAFLIRTGAQLWIQHDFAGNAARRKAPAYYD